jgi:2'-5' RNA ligase
MKRLFVAVDISREAIHKVSNYIEELRNEFSTVRVGWEKAEKLHLTLKFLGDSDANQLQKLSEIVAEIAAQIPPFSLRIAETGVFPSTRKARILWIDVKDEKGSLTWINKILEKECAGIGFAEEHRIFKPHLTIGRLREPEKSKQLVERHLQKEFEPVDMEVAEILIYESRLHPAGSIYEKLTTVQLKN